MPPRRRPDWDSSSDSAPCRRRRRSNGGRGRAPSSTSHECGLCDDASDDDVRDVASDAETEEGFDDNALEEHLLGMYACKAMSAKSFCITCYLICQRGAGSENMKLWGLPPGLASDGHYKRHLRATLPQAPCAPEFCMVSLLVFQQNSRQIRRVPFAPAHELLDAEPNCSGDDALEWPKLFDTHPLRTITGDARRVYAISLYTDAVKFTKQDTAGKSDSATGIWVYLLKTGKRHLCAVLSKQQTCRCGCRGNCGNFVALDFLRWCFEAAAHGRRPTVRWDGAQFPAESKLGQLSISEPLLMNRYIVCQIKGDWSEFAHFCRSVLGIVRTWVVCFARQTRQTGRTLPASPLLGILGANWQVVGMKRRARAVRSPLSLGRRLCDLRS